MLFLLELSVVVCSHLVISGPGSNPVSPTKTLRAEGPSGNSKHQVPNSKPVQIRGWFFLCLIYLSQVEDRVSGMKSETHLVKPVM